MDVGLGLMPPVMVGGIDPGRGSLMLVDSLLRDACNKGFGELFAPGSLRASPPLVLVMVLVVVAETGLTAL